MLNFGFNEAAGWVHHQPHAADMQAEAVPRVWCLSNRDKKKMLVRLRIVELDVDSALQQAIRADIRGLSRAAFTIF
jgi:hypothetical protein